MKTDYPELTGKLIELRFPEQGNLYYKTAVLRCDGCNYHIGVTLFNRTGGYYQVCLNGPSSPAHRAWVKKHKQRPVKRVQWRRAFHFCVKFIQRGFVTPKELETVKNFFSEGTVGKPTAKTCPFSQ